MFIYQADDSSTTQLTAFADSDITDVTISGDGQLVFFNSDADPTGGNAAGDQQIFAINADGTGIRQVTTVASFPQGISVSDDGSLVTYSDTADPFGTNVDGSSEIFIINLDGSGHVQLTSGTGTFLGGVTFAPKISADGTKVAFMSIAELLGANTDGTSELYMVNADGTGLVRITNDDRESGRHDDSRSGSFGLTSDGSIIAFSSNGNLLELNSDNVTAVYWADSSGGNLTQQVREGETIPDFLFGPAESDAVNISAGGGIISYVADSGAWDPDTSFSSPAGESIYAHIRQ